MENPNDFRKKYGRTRLTSSWFQTRGLSFRARENRSGSKKEQTKTPIRDSHSPCVYGHTLPREQLEGGVYGESERVSKFGWGKCGIWMPTSFYCLRSNCSMSPPDSDRSDSAGFLWAHGNLMVILSHDGERIALAEAKKPTEPIAQRSASPGRAIRALRKEEPYGEFRHTSEGGSPSTPNIHC